MNEPFENPSKFEAYKKLCFLCSEIRDFERILGHAKNFIFRGYETESFVNIKNLRFLKATIFGTPKSEILKMHSIRKSTIFDVSNLRFDNIFNLPKIKAYESLIRAPKNLRFFEGFLRILRVFRKMDQKDFHNSNFLEFAKLF